MAVFYSFHYGNDVRRVQLIENIGALERQKILKHQDWEEVKRKGTSAVQEWIDEQMKYKSAVIVLIGRETASRPWVRYEIAKAWQSNKPLLGIRIHGIADMANGADSPGPDPFQEVLGRGHAIPILDPTRTFWNGAIDTKATYSTLSSNLVEWSKRGVVSK